MWGLLFLRFVCYNEGKINLERGTDMKITFLGTSDGIPRPGHHCACTLIEIGDAMYLIDAGAPVVDLLLARGRHPNQLKALFNTHGHGDHFDGLLNLLDLSNWAYKEASYDVLLPEKAIGDALVNVIEVASRREFASDRMRISEFSAGVIFDDGTLRVTAIPTRHCEPKPSYAFLLEGDDRRVLMTGDLSQFLKKGDFPEIIANEELDLVVCEMAHFGFEHIAPYLKDCRAKQVVFNHYQLRKERDIEQLKQCGGFAFPVIMAEDGLVLQP